MRDVCFIADVAVLPRWMRVSQALDYVAGVHPRFDRAKAEGFLARTAIKRASKVRELSKGMVTQLHLALVMAIDASLLVLDEPTLGLDILFRKQFYDSLLNDYFDRSRTIVVTTHQVEEIQHVLTDLMFIDRGRIVLDCSMEEFESRYLEVMVHPEHVAAARALGPIHERQVFGRSILLFDRVDREQLAALGEVRTPSIADLFVAVMGNQAGEARGAADEHSIERRARVACRLAGNRARGPVGDSAAVLVGAARAVGEPLDLHRAAGRRRRRAVRLPDQHASSAAPRARGTGARPGGAARRARHAVQHRRDPDHRHDLDRRGVLLSRRAVRRAPRSQHPVLEVAAGVGSHDRALEGEHSARRPAGDRLRDQPGHAAGHAAVEHRRPAAERHQGPRRCGRGCRSSR